MAYNKYYVYKEMVSNDGGETWSYTGNETPSGNTIGVYETLAECERYTPPTTDYRWVDLDPSVDYYCSGTDKYIKQQRQISIDGGITWTDVVPAEYQMGGIAETESPDCGYVPPVIYRWVDLDPSVDYYCSGTTKYYKQQRQVSYNGGETWQNVIPEEYQWGGIFEVQSQDCGYYPPIYRWVDGGTMCIDYAKYERIVKQVSNDNGETWENVEPLEESATTLIEKCSVDCGASATISTSGDYFTVHALEDGNYYFGFDSQSTSHEIYYWSIDGGETWEEAYMTYNIIPELKACGRIMFKASWNNDGWTYSGFRFYATGKCELEGNLLSMAYNDEFKNLPNYGLNAEIYGSDLFNNWFFHPISRENIYSAEHLVIPNGSDHYEMFHDCINLTTPPQLPATDLHDRCYKNMFKGCRSLTITPELPATALAQYCYSGMFSGCTSLTTVLELPATTLASHCYEEMFEGCTSLTTVLELPATTLADYCYGFMFKGCTSLTTAPQLPATILANDCYYDMFNSCSSLVNAPQLPATTLAGGCYFGMFDKCTSLTTAPQLPATTLAGNCYFSMFAECISLTNAPVLPATILAGGCYAHMFEGCTSLTTAPELPATKVFNGSYYSMFQGCTSLTQAPELPATTLEQNCYYQMFKGCTNLTQAPSILPATDKAPYQCYYGMFSGCRSLTTAPELPTIEDISSSAHDFMFYGCISLNYVKCLDTEHTNSRYNWLSYVASSGTFVKLSGVEWSRGDNGIPNNWTIQDT